MVDVEILKSMLVHPSTFGNYGRAMTKQTFGRNSPPSGLNTPNSINYIKVLSKSFSEPWLCYFEFAAERLYMQRVPNS